MALGTLDAVVKAYAQAVPVREEESKPKPKPKARKSKGEDAVVEEPAGE